MSWESFSIGGIHLSDFNIYIASTKSGLPNEVFMPSKEIYTSSVAFQTGEYYWGQKLNGYEFTLPCIAHEVTEGQKNQIQQLFNFDKPKPLILDRRNYRYINVVVSDKIDWNYIWSQLRYNLYSMDIFNGIFELPLYTPDPIWRSLFDSTDVLGYLEDIDNYPTLYYDLNMPYLEDIPNATQTITQSPTNLQLFNGGNIYSLCEIILIGSGTNIVITNTTTNQSCTINNMNNETIIIDGNKGQIHNNISLKTSKFSGNFIKINPNYNDITITGSNLNLTITFKYKYCYL